MSKSTLQNNTKVLAEFFGIPLAKAQEAILAYATELKTTPEIAAVRIAQALWIHDKLRLDAWTDALAVFALPEPKFDQTHWFRSLKAITYARIGLTEDQRPRKQLEMDESAVANWYHLCRTPHEVFALHFQLGQTHLAIWRLAHMWEEQKQSPTA